MVKVKHKRYLARAEARRAECKAKGIPDDSYSNRQLKEAARTLRKATRNKLEIIKKEALKRAKNKNEHLAAPHSKSRKNAHVKAMYAEFRQNLKAQSMTKPKYKAKIKSKEARLRKRQKDKARGKKRKNPRSRQAAAAGTPGGAASSAPWMEPKAKYEPSGRGGHACPPRPKSKKQKTLSLMDAEVQHADDEHDEASPVSDDDDEDVADVQEDGTLWQSEL
jgi:hypothetical protein